VGELNKYAVKGVKKLFGLTRTKIRLAGEADTLKTSPSPLPLVEQYSGETVSTVDEARRHVKHLDEKVGYEDPESVASTTLQLCDVVEGVKHGYEPEKYMCLLSQKDFQEIEDRVSAGEQVNILLMDDETRGGANVYIGYDPPEDAYHLGRVMTNITWYLAYALESPVLSEEERFKNMNVYSTKQTLLQAAVEYSLKYFGGGG